MNFLVLDRLKSLLVSSLFFAFVIGHAQMNAGWLVNEEFISPALDHFDCHTSSIVETKNGNYCVVWKGGPGEGQCNCNGITKNVGIWLSLFDGEKWSESKEIVSAPTSVCWNPVLSKDSQGELLLFYRIGPDPRQVVSFLMRSHDGGMQWTSGEILPAGIVGPTKNKPIVSSSGRIISPSSVEVGNPEEPFKATACWIEISEDNAHHWKKIGPLAPAEHPFGLIEPTLFFDKQGRLRMLCRDRANRIGEKGFIWTAISEDEGVHWSEFKQTCLPNPDAGLDVVDLGAGKLILIYNHSHTNRYPLNLAVSLDGGDHWSQPVVLSELGEFPSGLLASDGSVHVTYAVKDRVGDQRSIKHAVIDPEELIREVKFD